MALKDVRFWKKPGKKEQKRRDKLVNVRNQYLPLRRGLWKSGLEKSVRLGKYSITRGGEIKIVHAQKLYSSRIGESSTHLERRTTCQVADD